MKARNLPIVIVAGLMLLWAPSPTKAIDLAEALDTTNLVWTTSGAQTWVAQTNVTHDGSDAASSGGVPYPLVANLQTVVAGPGTLTFWWRATNQQFSGLSPLMLMIDGSYQGKGAANRMATGDGLYWPEQSYLPLVQHVERPL